MIKFVSGLNKHSVRRIVKNAVMLYVHMFITMIVWSYKQRVVLSLLGVEDFGTNGFLNRSEIAVGVA